MSGNPFQMMMETSYSESQALQQIKKSIKELSEHEVFVGVPKEANEEHLENGVAPITPINNAHLLYIHSYGSPVRNIPSREVLEPAMRHHKTELKQMMEGITQQALRGQLSNVRPALERLGTYGQNISRGWFTNPANNWPVLHTKTIEKKGSERPLIDTGQLRNAITYVVDKKGARR